MKSWARLLVGTVLVVGGVLNFNVLSGTETAIASAQIENLLLVPPEAKPPQGTFWSWQKQDGEPPLPFNPFPLLSLYEIGTNTYTYDDSIVNYVTLREDAAVHLALQKVEQEYGLETPILPELGVFGDLGSGMALMESEGPPSPPGAGEGEVSAAGEVSPAYDYPANTLWLKITSVTNNLAHLIVHGTVPDVAYEILSRAVLTNVPWASEGTILGASGQDWTPTMVPVGTRTNTLFLWARSWFDNDGDGLPDWWELEHDLDPNNPDTSDTGISDGYKDADGDGWTNLQEYQNGTNPSGSDTPPPPRNVTARIDATGSNVLIHWETGGGAIQEHILYRYNWDTYEYDEIARLPITTISFTDEGVGFMQSLDTPSYLIYGVTSNNVPSAAVFVSAASAPALRLYLVHGLDRQMYAISEDLQPGLTNIGFYSWNYFDVSLLFNFSPTNFQNGIALLPTNVFPELGPFEPRIYFVAGFYESGKRSPNSYVFPPLESEAFIDASEYVKANLRFWLRAATSYQPFGYVNGQGAWGHYPSPPAYEFARAVSGPLPEADNFTWKNFLLDPSDGSAIFGTGVYRDRLFPGTFYPPTNVCALTSPQYVWTAPRTNPPGTPPVMATNNSTWVFFDEFSLDYDRAASVGLSLGGGGLVSLAANARNAYGLPIHSVALLNATNVLTFISPGNSAYPGSVAASFFQTEVPQLQTRDYLFVPTAAGSSHLQPGQSGFNPTNTTPLLIASVGQRYTFAAYARQAILNGDTNKFAFSGQYFDNAYRLGTNGMPIGHVAGVLNEHGEFIPTEPGPVLLTTKPDADQGGIQGTCLVHVVKLQLDANHDGVMDFAYAGPDHVTVQTPFVFWMNNDIDRGHNVDGSDFEEDDLSNTDPLADSPGTPGRSTPDCEYLTETGQRAIPSKRDLEDYARIWIPEFTALYEAYPDLDFELTVRNSDNAAGPAIDLFQAAEAEGRNGYLTDESVATAQLGLVPRPAIGRIQPNATLNLKSYFLLQNPSDYFLFCGAKRGKGELVLQIKSGTNLLAETSTWIEIKDIKEMYERWTVGEVSSKAPTTVATHAVEDLPTGVPAFRYDSASDTNLPYILFVHGWNMERWEKDRFAEAAFKRLYWQGYQGRFGIYRWPTANRFGDFELLKPLANNPLTDGKNYDNSEFNAWRSAVGLLNLTSNLNTSHPSNVYLLAHSMGNVVAGEALRLAGTNRWINTYVASQAAITAQAYDQSITNAQLFFIYDHPSIPNIVELLYAPQLNYGPTTPNIYGNWFGNNGAGATRCVNFYNENDWALATSRWEYNQITKPDSGLSGNYTYEGSLDDLAPWNHFAFVLTDSTSYPLDIVGDLTDRYKVMAYAAESRCRALGVMDVAPMSDNVDLQTIWPADIEDEFPNSYSRHKWHSAQFRSTNMKQRQYWESLLGPDGFQISP